MTEPTEQALESPRERPCPICGGRTFTWGKAIDSNTRVVHFRPEGGIWGEGVPMQLRRCDTCGNIQLFA